MKTFLITASMTFMSIMLVTVGMKYAADLGSWLNMTYGPPSLTTVLLVCAGLISVAAGIFAATLKRI